ncbi:hypothetical protein ABT297_02830 [Dactylosporangium sp. NPDC000555]|uniref:hypothetical protein n=1 Tax=Dactylosporangium sp. NPDC000555 TaxID=3154260 RepID=UPI00331A0A31
MRTHEANGETRLLFWLRIREFAVPPPMIESATARRAAGDWGGACAAARVDVDLNLRILAKTQGHELAGSVRADLRHLAPDLLRWHMPRIAPDGLLRPGLTVALARYGPSGTGGLHLVARMPPAWAGAGQRISLALWDGGGAGEHPHPRPDRHFRFDLHRHLWDARRAGELPERSGGPGRWAAEAAILRRADGRVDDEAVVVRLGGRHRLLLERSGRTRPARRGGAAPPVLPHAATWEPPDTELLRAGLIDAGRLHPLVARALAPQRAARHRDEHNGGPGGDGGTRQVDCRGARHRIGLVGGALVALDHDPEQLRREELLAALGGPPLPCLQAIDEVYRHPECLDDVRARLDHGDADGALAAVEGLLGPGVPLRDGALRDALETAVRRRLAHGMFRAGLDPRAPDTPARRDPRRRGDVRAHPRNATNA